MMIKNSESIKSQIEEMRKGLTLEKLPHWADNHIESLINTVLVMRNRWKTAKPRIEKYKNQYSYITTLVEFDCLIKSMPEQEFCKMVLCMNITKPNFWRYKMLCDMVEAFIKYQKENGFTSDRDGMEHWAQNCDILNLHKDTIGQIQNVGLATIQNLRICLGIPTIKPDVRVRNALDKLGLRNDVGICELLAELAELTGYSPFELDQIFWKGIVGDRQKAEDE
jgi:hypothetical protein